ncbi:major histocompatibility complex class I-related gene protein-like isoform X5 [Anolis carolinensis]|uniref:major histocompatibility complex class I-related gene protein-like isoform X5 n=1 Tax=Anolis carolinensis TaxID=28377 RepID=UPI002F2B5549
MARLLLLRVVSVLLLGHPGIALPPPAPGVSSSSSHSLRYFYTAASEDNKSFIIVGYVDDQRICQYDSTVKEKRPSVPWMSKVEEEDPSYWKDESEVSRNAEVFFKESLVIARNRYNQSGGFHTLQQMYGCDLRKDGSKAGYRQYAYDGKDFISFDKETLTWTAADVEAQITKRTWDAQSTQNQYLKAYLEEECIEWLEKYLEYGKETLLRTETPEVMVTRKVDHDGMETLICRVGGFYPKEIDIEWTRDGEVWTQDVFHGLVSPNSDGTYYTWRSITVDPKERERYQCHVEHDGLLKPVDVAWEEPASNLGLIIECVVVALLAIAYIAVLAFLFIIEYVLWALLAIAAIAVLAVYFTSKLVLIGCAVGILLPITGLAVYFQLILEILEDFRGLQNSNKKVLASDQKFNISEEGSDKKSNTSKEESDEGFASTEEASEKDSHNSEESTSLCSSGSSGSTEAV